MRRQAEEALRVSEMLLGISEASADVGSWELNVATGQLIWSDEAYQIFGIKPEEFGATYEAFLDIVHPDDRAAVDAVYSDSLRTGLDNYDLEHRIVRHDSGEIRIVHEKCRHVKDDSGRIVSSMGMVQDITERKKVEEKLRKSERLLTETGKMAKVGGWEVDAETLEVSWTEETYHIHGVPLDYDPTLDEAIDFFHPCDRPKLENAIQRALRYGEPYDMEIRFITAKGKHLWTHTVCKPSVLKGKTVRLNGTFQDITERKQAEEALRRRTAELDTLLNTIPAPVYFQDKDLRYVAVNKAFIDWVDLPLEAIVGKTDTDLFAEELSTEFQSTDHEVIKSGRSITDIEQKVPNATGEMLYVSTSKTPVISKEGDKLGVVGISFDITAQKRMQQQIQAALQEKENLLRDIHHRVKNNLHVVSSLLRLQTRALKDKIDPVALEGFREAQDRIQSMAMIHERLYQSQDFARVDFRNYIQAIAHNLIHAYTVQTDKVTLDIQADDVPVNLNQAVPCGLIVNELVSNCLKHAFPGDRQGRIEIQFHECEDGYLELVVSDDGVGFQEDIPLEATQTLGMTLVITLVSQLDGEVVVDRNGGSRFQIRFKAE